MDTTNRIFLNKCSDIYRSDLVQDVLPFWLANGLDKVHGGFYTCLDRDGSRIDSTKSVWFQGRAGYIYAAAYNKIEPRKEWLEASRSAIEFMEKYCFDTDGRMFFEITADGKPLRKRRYLFSESFAAIAMAEYAKASGDKTYARKALNLFKLILHYKNTPGSLPSKYTKNLQTRGHSLPMILINTAARIRDVISDPVLEAQIDESIHEIRNYFMHPEFEALLETVGMNGEFIDTGMGRMINPGHAIETAWFLLDEARYRNWDKALVKTATTILDWSWKWGWDETYGGIINFRDCKNLPCQDYAQDMKFWWPHAETIVATLYAFLATGDKKYLEMHRKIHEYTYKHFPDAEYGEWYGYLHHDGTVAQPAKGNLFKGPFHIPRMLMYSHWLCEEILSQ
ncbi:MAG: AGE family epimerase/isomerase [Paludibacter sp.]|nr:AGE family epimerase/isomerase [Paludibacter sp.]MDD4198443.1 AGE family epimerase/isomerase [Paludibacter sp.]MDD4427155.1 AGE family epimerase/isomerase [Paludibacter sp.]